jgi:hypothetical protein
MISIKSCFILAIRAELLPAGWQPDLFRGVDYLGQGIRRFSLFAARDFSFLLPKRFSRNFLRLPAAQGIDISHRGAHRSFAGATGVAGCDSRLPTNPWRQKRKSTPTNPWALNRRLRRILGPLQGIDSNESLVSREKSTPTNPWALNRRLRRILGLKEKSTPTNPWALKRKSAPTNPWPPPRNRIQRILGLKRKIDSNESLAPQGIDFSDESLSPKASPKEPKKNRRILGKIPFLFFFGTIPPFSWGPQESGETTTLGGPGCNRKIHPLHAYVTITSCETIYGCLVLLFLVYRSISVK